MSQPVKKCSRVLTNLKCNVKTGKALDIFVAKTDQDRKKTGA